MQSSNNPQTRIPNERDKVAAAIKILIEQNKTSKPFTNGQIAPKLDENQLVTDLTTYIMEQKNDDFYRGDRNGILEGQKRAVTMLKALADKAVDKGTDHEWMYVPLDELHKVIAALGGGDE